MSLLNGFTSVNESTLSNDITNNIFSYLDYGLLEKGNGVNVNIPQSGVYGGANETLRPFNDVRYGSGQVWQGFRSNWVWETGVGANVSSDTSRPGVSGVYVNNVFYPTSTTGTYAHYIDHINGRVVFNQNIPTSSVVKCNFTYKYINVVIGGQETIQQIHQQSLRSDKNNFIKQSGEWGQFPENRVQLPAIVIELLPSKESKPHALGGTKYYYRNYAIHCIAEDSYTRSFMTDIIEMQKEKTIKMYNLNNIASDNKFPLDYRGVPNSGALSYYDLVNSYPGNNLTLSAMKYDSIYELGDIYIGTLKCTTEVILGV